MSTRKSATKSYSIDSYSDVSKYANLIPFISVVYTCHSIAYLTLLLVLYFLDWGIFILKRLSFRGNTKRGSIYLRINSERKLIAVVTDLSQHTSCYMMLEVKAMSKCGSRRYPLQESCSWKTEDMCMLSECYGRWVNCNDALNVFPSVHWSNKNQILPKYSPTLILIKGLIRVKVSHLSDGDLHLIPYRRYKTDHRCSSRI